MVTNNIDFGHSMLFVTTFIRAGLSDGRLVGPNDRRHPDRFRHAADLDFAHIDRSHIARFRDGLRRGQDLAAAGERSDAGRHVDTDSTEVIAALRGVIGV